MDDLKKRHFRELALAMLELTSEKEVESFLSDLCSPNELKAMVERWRVVRMLERAMPYRSIYEKTGVSTATITRVARSLGFGQGGYRLVLERIKEKNQ